MGKTTITVKQLSEELNSATSPHFAIVCDERQFLLNHLDKQLSSDNLTDIQEMLRQETGLTLPVKVIDKVLQLYPEARIKFAVLGPDNEQYDIVLDAFADFLVGSKWPTWEDINHEAATSPGYPIEGDVFRAKLKQQAIEIGLNKGA